jgi:Tfp pilus assembly protein PilX
MRRRRNTLRNERGIALVLAIVVLLCLTGIMFAFLSVGSLEPQISKNLVDASRARYLAEAGIERGFNVLVATADGSNSWSGLLGAATAASPWVAVPGLTNQTLPDAASGGTFSVIIRNDNGADDTPITGMSAATNPTMDSSPTADDNKTVIMRSTATVSSVTKTIEVVVRRVMLPPFPGAVNIPGWQSDVYISTPNFDFDGRDYACTAPGTGCDAAENWSVNGANPLKYGVAVQPGSQSNNNRTFSANVESSLDSTAKRNAVKGRDRTNPGGPSTTGLNAVSADASLTPSVMENFVNLVASNPNTTILQSTMACPMVFSGSASGLTNTPTLSNGCGTSSTVNLGSRQDPKLVYFRGEPDTTSSFTGLTLNNGIKGAGILVIEDGDLKNFGNLEWDGLVIITGSYTSMAMMNGSSTTIRGASVAYEKQPGEASGYFDFYVGAVSGASVRASKQNIDMVQLMRALHSITNWREI